MQNAQLRNNFILLSPASREFIVLLHTSREQSSRKKMKSRTYAHSGPPNAPKQFTVCNPTRRQLSSSSSLASLILMQKLISHRGRWNERGLIHSTGRRRSEELIAEALRVLSRKRRPFLSISPPPLYRGGTLSSVYVMRFNYRRFNYRWRI